MYIRNLKSVFVILISLLALVYALQNIVNLQACHAAFVYVMSNADHKAYAESFGPAVSSPVLTWLALVFVIGGELAAGLLAGRGAFAMWSARMGPVEDFRRAKKFALIGCGVGIIVWLGFFNVIGGAYFQMWQTTAGQASMDDAFEFVMACALVFIIVSMPEEWAG